MYSVALDPPAGTNVTFVFAKLCTFPLPPPFSAALIQFIHDKGSFSPAKSDKSYRFDDRMHKIGYDVPVLFIGLFSYVRQRDKKQKKKSRDAQIR